LITNWINSRGGPLICATSQAGGEWRGVGGTSTKAAKTDYERASDVLDYLGVIPCSSSDVLVLGDEPMQSAFATVEQGLVIVRWVSCVSRARAEELIGNLPLQLPFIEDSINFTVREPNLYLFDSALDRPLVVGSGVCRIDMTPGRYAVTVERYEREHEFEFLVHRFLPIR